MATQGEVPTEAWLGEPLEAWRERWRVPVLRAFTRTGSTNDVARSLAEQGAPAGAVVIADEQTRGRGQRGRSWHAGPGTGLLLSVVLRPQRVGRPGVLPLRLGMAVARAIERVAPVAVRLKWPNDLFIGSRKVGGVLCEATLEAGRPLFVIAGIGVNVSQGSDEWPPALRGRATSIEIESGRRLSRGALAGAVLEEVLDAGRQGLRLLDGRERDELRARDLLRGHGITADGAPAGIAAGVDADGALLVDRDGARSRLVAGTIRLVESAEVET